MELRQYWRIVRRWLWIVILLPVVVLAGSLALRRPAAPLHQANLRLSVGVIPEESDGRYYTYDTYYAWTASEYLADDFSEVVRSRLFAEDVLARLRAQGRSDLDIGAIQGATSPQKTHRILSVTITASSDEQAMAIASAIADVLQENAGKYLAQLSAQRAAIAIIDPPALVPATVGLRQQLDLPLRLVLALAVGLGLAFLLDYLDDSLRDAAEAEALGWHVIGEIPTSRRWLQRI
jgi:capsular polysaccharide biosynthesis protein